MIKIGRTQERTPKERVAANLTVEVGNGSWILLDERAGWIIEMKFKHRSARSDAPKLSVWYVQIASIAPNCSNPN